MIIDTWDNFPQYLKFLPKSKIIGDYINQNSLNNINNFAALPLGKNDIATPNFFLIHNKYKSEIASNRKWESHQKYIDVQIVISGGELAKVGDIKSFWDNISKEYNPESDAVFYQPSQKIINFSASLSLKAGSFAIFYPQDAHITGIHPEENPAGENEVDKIVFKILIE